MAEFDPEPGSKVTIFGEPYVVDRHPGAGDRAYSAEGRRADVFRLIAVDGRRHALKVFKTAYRDVGQTAITAALSRHRDLPGLTAAGRRVLGPGEPAVRQFPDLEHGVLMPWIEGQTWHDVLQSVQTRDVCLRRASAVHLCHRFLEVVVGLEERQLAHTDIAPGNVVFHASSNVVELVDLEDMHGPAPEFVRPGKVNRGTPGYNFLPIDAAQGLWRPDGDRFAALVLASEILALSDPGLSTQVWGESFFNPTELKQPGAPRYAGMLGFLRGVSPDFARLFEAAWTARSLQDCPKVLNVRHAMAALVAGVQREAGDIFVPRGAAPVPSAPSAVTSVVWEAFGTPVVAEPTATTSSVVWEPAVVSSGGPARPPSASPEQTLLDASGLRVTTLAIQGRGQSVPWGSVRRTEVAPIPPDRTGERTVQTLGGVSAVGGLLMAFMTSEPLFPGILALLGVIAAVFAKAVAQTGPTRFALRLHTDGGPVEVMDSPQEGDVAHARRVVEAHLLKGQP